MNFKFFNMNIKNVLAFTLFLLSIIRVDAQINYGVHIAVNSSSITNDFDDKIEMKDRLKNRIGWSISAIFKNQISERFSASMGIGYAHKSYDVMTNDLRWPSQITSQGFIFYKPPVDGVLGDHLGIRDFRYVILPVTLSYAFAKIGSNSVSLRAGISATWLIDSEVYVESENINHPGLPASLRKTGINLNGATNNLNLFTNIGLEVEILNSESFSLSIIPSLGIEAFSSAIEIDNHRIISYALGVQTTF